MNALIPRLIKFIEFCVRAHIRKPVENVDSKFTCFDIQRWLLHEQNIGLLLRVQMCCEWLIHAYRVWWHELWILQLHYLIVRVLLLAFNIEPRYTPTTHTATDYIASRDF